MCLILIFGACYSGAGMLARRVSAELGYRLIDRDAIVERAAAWGVPHANLREALGPIPALRMRFRQHSGAELAALRAGLAEEAADGGGVYSGCEGFLLPRRAGPALRIRLKVPLEHRVAELGRRLKLTDAEARRHIRSADRARRRWVQLAGFDDEDRALYDLVVNIDDGDFDSACKSIVRFVTHQAPVKVRA
ncbi:MAG: cytidylate kinase-like family protein [Bryobacterales bacterium]|nr:cytidylate kinase-like family protein [Bryobacterales bacterium]